MPSCRPCLVLEMRTYMYIFVYYHCGKDQIDNRAPKMSILRFKFILYAYFDSCLIFKTLITQNIKSPVLQTGGSDNSKSRNGNDLKFVTAFLDSYLYRLSNGFSFSQIFFLKNG